MSWIQGTVLALPRTEQWILDGISLSTFHSENFCPPLHTMQQRTILLLIIYFHHNMFSKLKFFFAVDWKFPIICAWLYQSLCLANRFWKNCTFTGRFKYWSRNPVGCRKSRGRLSDWCWKSHLNFLSISDEIGIHAFVTLEENIQISLEKIDQQNWFWIGIQLYTAWKCI